jgi:hypothetical protein
MRDWFARIEPAQVPTPTDGLILLTLGFAFGCMVAGVYRLTAGRRRPQPGLLATLVLLTILACLVTVVIGDNTARAFGLVGALAIVRFRTVVEDTRDTAFVIFAVIEGMAVGAGFALIALAGVPFVALAAFLFRGREPASEGVGFVLSVRLGAARPPEQVLGEAFGRHLRRWRLTAAATARGGAALDLTYAVHLAREAAAVALVAELNGVEGVQQVELKEKG